MDVEIKVILELVQFMSIFSAKQPKVEHGSIAMAGSGLCECDHGISLADPNPLDFDCIILREEHY